MIATALRCARRRPVRRRRPLSIVRGRALPRPIQPDTPVSPTEAMLQIEEAHQVSLFDFVPAPRQKKSVENFYLRRMAAAKAAKKRALNEASRLRRRKKRRAEMRALGKARARKTECYTFSLDHRDRKVPKRTLHIERVKANRFEWTEVDAHRMAIGLLLDSMKALLGGIGSGRSSLWEILYWINSPDIDAPFSFETCVAVTAENATDPAYADLYGLYRVDVDLDGIDAEGLRDLLNDHARANPAYRFDYATLLKRMVLDLEAGSEQARDWFLGKDGATPSAAMAINALGFDHGTTLRALGLGEWLREQQAEETDESVTAESIA